MLDDHLQLTIHLQLSIHLHAVRPSGWRAKFLCISGGFLFLSLLLVTMKYSGDWESVGWLELVVWDGNVARLGLLAQRWSWWEVGRTLNESLNSSNVRACQEVAVDPELLGSKGGISKIWMQETEYWEVQTKLNGDDAYRCVSSSRREWSFAWCARLSEYMTARNNRARLAEHNAHWLYYEYMREYVYIRLRVVWERNKIRSICVNFALVLKILIWDMLDCSGCNSLYFV